ncbi:RDD family protein [Mycobacterium ostraviense]|uniref:RDD family protein n=1 Tax=Mycobacterium ostraviense TaxID=2738409 RepID=UPI001A7EA050|nr:RDD family protein [Mycobacterium ostraviense]
MTAPLPPPGWYPVPEDTSRRRYWDGAAWTHHRDGSPHTPAPRDQVETVVVENRSPDGPDKNGRASGLTVTRGISLILLALLFGPIASASLPEGPTHWNEYATAGADTIWRTYFLAVLALCVVALILGILSLARPAFHPMLSVIDGAAVIIIGVVGCLLGLLSVGNGSDVATPLTFLGTGSLFALGGGITTLLSAIAVADRRRSGAQPSSMALPPGLRPGPLGLRFLARLIDGILVVIVAVPLAVLAEIHIGATGLFPGLFSGLLAFSYFVAFEASQGWTLGKKLLGMRVRGPDGAEKPTVRQSAVRNVFTLLAIIPFLGEVLVLVAGVVIAATIRSSPTKQGKHDEFAGGTQVVKVLIPVTVGVAEV